VSLIGAIPKVGAAISEPFAQLMTHQKATLHNLSDVRQEGGILAFVLEKVVMAMVIYFIISIINSMAQSYHKRLSRDKNSSAKIKS